MVFYSRISAITRSDGIRHSSAPRDTKSSSYVQRLSSAHFQQLVELQIHDDDSEPLFETICTSIVKPSAHHVLQDQRQFELNVGPVSSQ
jgi:hypothetical protein